MSGGLVHVHGKVHSLFLNIERVVQKHLCLLNNTSKVAPNLKEIITNSIITKDANVLQSWANVGIELAEADKIDLFSMIVGLFITIQGFSFVSGYVEIPAVHQEIYLWRKSTVDQTFCKLSI